MSYELGEGWVLHHKPDFSGEVSMVNTATGQSIALGSIDPLLAISCHYFRNLAGSNLSCHTADSALIKQITAMTSNKIGDNQLDLCVTTFSSVAGLDIDRERLRTILNSSHKSLSMLRGVYPENEVLDSMDTQDRDQLMDTIATALVGRCWPTWGQGNAYAELFYSDLHKALQT